MTHPYTRLSRLKPGDVIITDSGFDCMGKNKAKVVRMTKVGRGSAGFTKMANRLYVCCREGKHLLDGQLDEKGRLIGIRKPQ